LLALILTGVPHLGDGPHQCGDFSRDSSASGQPVDPGTDAFLLFLHGINGLE